MSELLEQLNKLEKSHEELIKLADKEIKSINKEIIQIHDEQMFIRDRIASLWMAIGILFLINCVIGFVLFLRLHDRGI